MEFAELILTPKLDGVILRSPLKEPVEGTLCITGHHIILSTRSDNEGELWLLHDNVDLIEKKASTNGPGGSIILKCKDFRIIQLQIKTNDFHNVAISLERLSSLDEITLRYPFFYRPMYKIIEDGWTAFRPETEFTKLLHRDEWRISHINSGYSVCPSYPRVVVVPKGIDDDALLLASRFREGGRFPVLSYRHEGGAALIRSSQPLTGPNNRRSREDEKLINSVITSGKRGYILDTRTQPLAQAAKARGGGFELEMHYPQWKRIHCTFDKQQNLLDSLTKLMEACNDVSLSSEKWLSKLDSSNWMTHLKDSLNSACLVAQFLDQEGASVLVHGAEGTDFTLLVTSLTQVILNPDCRTVRGFEALIEREWIQGGYPFSKRHAHSCYSSPSSRNRSEAPVFLMFLDCIYQIHSQFPCSFEFSVTFLIWLFEHSYSSQFGTFLGNNEMERAKLSLTLHTTSLWSYVNQPEILHTILNPLYEPNNSVIWPSVAPMSFNLWSSIYLRWVINQNAEKENLTAVTALKEREKELRLVAGRLRRRLLELEKELEISQLDNLDKDMHTKLSISHSYSCSSTAKE
uniref:Putative phosphatidylinositol 3-phosphate 3-phosphatase myotubularin mtm1 n=1 Tax=Panstrongylus lignarius TaxID=156445 RepID=A0A224XDV7_9HEMI